MRPTALLLLGAMVACSSKSRPPRVTTREELGAMLFSDPRLSEPAGQACTDCHALKSAFADPEDDRTSIGVIKGRFGPRNTMSAMYAALVPSLHRDNQGHPIGGLFWDGRANSLEDQAASPLLNPLEMNNKDQLAVVAKVRAAYGPELVAVFGKDVLGTPDKTFAAITQAIGAFERMPAFAPFSSKYDAVLAGKATLSESEARGLAIFEDPARGNCAACHPSRPADGKPPMFTTYGYANLGIPRFNDNPFYLLPSALNPDGQGHIDMGLGKTTGNAAETGMFRIPSLRNVERTAPYGHNGYFRRLDEMIAFLSPDAQALPPEVTPSPRAQVAAAPLSTQDIEDLVAFLATLTDAEVIAAHP